jgi:GTP-binding protein YchF
MSLSVGIVGLPNVGKSTLFNALLKKQQAYVANFPFATIEPNIGVVPVPNEKLKKLALVTKESEGMNNLPPEVPATCEFVDIAGLIAGAHKGEGLGNKFLSHIREVDAICHVVRLFSDKDIIKSGSIDPKSDFETVETELKLADFETLEKQKDPGNTPDKDLRFRWDVIQKVKEELKKGIPVRELDLSDEEILIVKQLSLLTFKPILIALNVDESDLKDSSQIEEKWAKEFMVQKDQVVSISAKIESELASLSEEEQAQYLIDLGVEKSGLERLINKAFSTLGLITFLTAGEKEVRAWTVKGGSNAQKASAVIHTDFEKNFIKADVVSFEDFTSFGGWKKSREEGKVRSEGKDYIIKDSDVIEFKIGS